MVVAGSAVSSWACALVLGVWWLASSEKRIATYSVTGAVSRVTLDLGGANAVVVGGGSGRAVQVRRTDSFSFGRRADARRAVSDGELRLRSRCPVTVLASCSASYRVRVPDNIPVTVRTSSGNVRFSAYRGSANINTTTGDISVGGYCGFLLQARAESGNVAGEHVVLARAARAALPLGRRPRDRPRRAATASTPTRTAARGGSPG